MAIFIILNIILIFTVVFLTWFLFKEKKNEVKDVCVNDSCGEIKKGKHKQNQKTKSERVFEGRFVTDEEYLQMTKNKKNSISNLMEEIEIEYEYLKKLNNGQ